MKNKKVIIRIILVIIAILVTPYIINIILLCPAITEIVGDNRDWLAFHGSYIGAVLGACATIYVLYKTIQYYRKQDTYKHEIDWLNEFRKICEDYISVNNPNKVMHIINDMTDNPEKAFFDCEKHINDIMDKDIRIALMCEANKNKELDEFHNRINEQFVSYMAYFNNIQLIVCFVRNESKKKDYNKYIMLEKMYAQTLNNNKETIKISADLISFINSKYNKQDKIHIPQLHSLLLDWLDDWPKFYNKTYLIVKDYISEKSDKIKKDYEKYV